MEKDVTKIEWKKDKISVPIPEQTIAVKKSEYDNLVRSDTMLHIIMWCFNKKDFIPDTVLEFANSIIGEGNEDAGT